MKACVLHSIGDLRYEEVDDPVPKDGEVLLRIKASGICGSDISRIYQKGTYTFPTIPGHEFSGEIVDVCGDVESGLIGKRAAVYPLLPCKDCDMCEVGEYASCRCYSYFGSRRDGGFAELITVPIWNLVTCDGNLSYEEMAMAEPAAVSVHALGQAGVSLGDTIAIFGAGAIGLMLAGFAKTWGAAKIILLDIDEQRLQFARSIGYEFTLNNRAGEWIEQLMEITDGKGVDLALEGAGVARATEGCFAAAKPLGKVVLMGNPLTDMCIKQNAYWDILRKQLTVIGTWNSSYTKKRNDWQIALDAMSSGVMDVSRLITHRFSFSQCKEAFAVLTERKDLAFRVIFVND